MSFVTNLLRGMEKAGWESVGFSSEIEVGDELMIPDIGEGEVIRVHDDIWTVIMRKRKEHHNVGYKMKDLILMDAKYRKRKKKKENGPFKLAALPFAISTGPGGKTTRTYMSPDGTMATEEIELNEMTMKQLLDEVVANMVNFYETFLATKTSDYSKEMARAQVQEFEKNSVKLLARKGLTPDDLRDAMRKVLAGFVNPADDLLKDAAKGVKK